MYEQHAFGDLPWPKQAPDSQPKDLTASATERARYWATSQAFDHATRQEVQGLLDSGNSSEIINRFYRDLEFGTGGLRGILGAGSCRMNIYNVRKATTALAMYLKSFFKDRDAGLSVAIAYDSATRAASSRVRRPKFLQRKAFRP
jgi:phosphoglucomutase